MPARAAFSTINPFTGVAGMVVLAILLVTTIFLTVFDLPWIAFLTGILCAAAIGLVGRLAYAETSLAEVRETVRYVDMELPTMIAYVSSDGQVRYHNQAFRSWLRARESTINGRSLRDVVGLTTYGQLRSGLDAAFAGRARHETWTHEGPGNSARFFTQYIPHVGERSEIVGAFILQEEVTSIEKSAAAAQDPGATTAAAAAPETAGSAPPAPVALDGERRIFVDTLTEELTDWKNAGDRLRAAIDNDEFCLYCQAIAPMTLPAEGGPFYEVLLRLREEEEGLMPPGAFLPLAEEYGLMPDLDRWVVRHVLDWTLEKPGRQAGLYGINISAPTICSAGFADFVVRELRERRAPGAVLCFEIQVEDARSNPTDAARLVSTLSDAGCRTTLCGFGQNAADYSLLKSLRVDFLKIDGDIVLGLARNPVDVIKLKAISRVARATNRRTIAEFVENDETIARLREHGVDFAQGFGISRPTSLSDLD